MIEKRRDLLQQDAVDKANAKNEDEFTKRKMAFLDTLLLSTVDGRPLTTQELYEEVSTFMFEVRVLKFYFL